VNDIVSYSSVGVNWQGTPVEQLPVVGLLGPNYPRHRQDVSGVPWMRRALVLNNRFNVLPVWSRDDVGQTPKFPDLPLAKFPPGWPVIGFFPTTSSPVWNADHPIFNCMAEDARRWASGLFDDSLNPLPHRDVVVSSRANAAAWLYQVIRYDIDKSYADTPSDMWNAIVEKDAEFLSQVWELVFGRQSGNQAPADQPIVRIKTTDAQIISRTGWIEVASYTEKGSKQLEELLLAPTTEWKCEV
jgi:hypothetical protein